MLIKKLQFLLFSLTPLLVPFFLMCFTDEVNWSLFDFLIMGALLLIFSLIGSLINNIFKGRSKAWFLYILGIIFLLVWTELAVGIFDSPFAGS